MTQPPIGEETCKPWTILVQGNKLFAAGVWLAGANQAKALVRWGLGRFLRRHLR